MKVDFIVTLDTDDEWPDNDSCDNITDEMHNHLRSLLATIQGYSKVSSRWRKTL